VKALSFFYSSVIAVFAILCAQIIHQTYGLSKKNMMKTWRIAQIRNKFLFIEEYPNNPSWDGPSCFR
jgi:hypothetical protein